MNRSIVRDREDAEIVGAITGRWWMHLLVGVLWMFFAFVVLSFDFRTVWAVSAFFGVGFLIGGLTELAVAAATPGWRWLHVLFGVAAIVAGVVALVWPGGTFLVLAGIIAWYILISGIVDLIAAFAMRDETELWWLGLVLGLAQILIGFWAAGYAGRSVALLVVWVGAAALGRGISELFIGFALHRADRQLRARLARF